MMNNPAVAPAAVDANAMWRNDAPALWQDIQAPKWQANRTAWLLTCVDLTSLLVGFFVLMFSTQTLQDEQWRALTQGFQERFAEPAPVVDMIPDGTNNAEVRKMVATSGLGYLDALLKQRMQGDPVWEGMVADIENDEVRYALPEGKLAAEGDAAWNRLGGALRGWKNPIGIRVIVAQAEGVAGARKAIALAEKLSNSGGMGAFADVVIDNKAAGMASLLVVRAK